MSGSERLKPQKLLEPVCPKLLKMFAPSMKNGRFSSKKVSKAVPPAT
jgi:hypothetical protein